ncbi:MAG: Mur ligase family protein [Bacteroidota bacterium]
MKVHLIAIGGAAMHNLAIALHKNGYIVQGSDDEIYGLSHENLSKHGLLPKEMGWNDDNIDSSIDFIILGMHAKMDNPELKKAQELGIPIYSYPEFLFRHAKDKKRVVIAGSHGKTTTTSMLMHVLKDLDIEFDYLVGAQIEGFDTMVKLSNAPTIVIEGDEYLSSALDRRPKIHHYKPHHACITGVAWDHMNVFKTFEIYQKQFEIFAESMMPESTLYYYANDEILETKIPKIKSDAIPYDAFNYGKSDQQSIVYDASGNSYTLNIFGKHNIENLKAAQLLAHDLGVSESDFLKSMESFSGAHKRMQEIYSYGGNIAFHDFAHAPSKLTATIKALKQQFPNKTIVACFELHTYSSLNKLFLPLYLNSMKAADIPIVFFQEHTLMMKRLEMLSEEDVRFGFGDERLNVFKDQVDLLQFLKGIKFENHVLAFLSSGSFGGLDLKDNAEQLFNINLKD